MHSVSIFGCLLCTSSVLGKGAVVVAKATSVLLLTDGKPHCFTVILSHIYRVHTHTHSLT